MADRLVGFSDVDDELYVFLESIEYQWKLADLSKLKNLKNKNEVEVLIYLTGLNQLYYTDKNLLTYHKTNTST